MGQLVTPEEQKVPDTVLPHGSEKDRRVFRRYTCHGTADVFVIGNGLHFSGKILDVSDAGCFVQTEHQLERGTHLELTFEIENMKFRLAGGIRMIKSRSGIGVEFTNMNARRKELIQDLLRELMSQVEQAANECPAVPSAAPTATSPAPINSPA